MSDALPPEEPRTVIGLRTALILFGALTVFAFATLKGTALVISLIVVFGLAAKSYIHYLRNRMD